jgi:alpha-beta hydrolase superfamily lysophospholipase
MLDGSPADAGFPYEQTTFTSADSVRLHGWFVPAPAPRATVLFCHGNGGNISTLTGVIAAFHEFGCNTFVFDYRGYGRSEGTPDETGTYTDAFAAWEYLTTTRGVPPREIVLVGRSLGGAVAAWLATRVQPSGLVLEAAFVSVPDMAAEVYPWLPATLLTRFRYDTRASLRLVTVPVLVIHSRDDEVVPFRHGQALFEAAPEPKRFLEIAGGHNDGFQRSHEAYRAAFTSFLDEVGRGGRARHSMP